MTTTADIDQTDRARVEAELDALMDNIERTNLEIDVARLRDLGPLVLKRRELRAQLALARATDPQNTNARRGINGEIDRIGYEIRKAKRASIDVLKEDLAQYERLKRSKYDELTELKKGQRRLGL